MESIFGVRWAALELNHVQAFLKGASGEGLTWEAKGHAPLKQLKHKIVEAVCALANQLGGFVIVGAESESKSSEGPWMLPGVVNDINEDAHDWICRVLNGRLTNPPPFDVRRWTLPDQRLVAAVIRVEPVPVPPCITIDGLVWQRMVAESKKVTEPLVLQDLIHRGEAARAAAREKSREAVARLIDMAPLVEGGQENARVAIALTPTAAMSDISSRLFREEFKEALAHAAGTLETAEWVAMTEPRPHRDGYVLWRGKAGPESWAWAMLALWNGTVCVEFAIRRQTNSSPPSVNTIIEQAWSAAASLLPELTGIPDKDHVPTFFALQVRGGDHFTLQYPQRLVRAPTTDGPVERWTTMSEPTPAEVSSVIRELARAVGVDALEPGGVAG